MAVFCISQDIKELRGVGPPSESLGFNCFTMKEYFIYEHWSTVHDVCFYVGLSHVPKADRVWKERTRYYRAYQNAKSGRRSKEWLEMAELGMEVRIVFETTDFNIACDKEIELIAKYKRKKFDKHGTLVNIDFGGVHLKGPRDHKVPINQIDIKTLEVIKVWPNPMSIEKELGFLRTNIVKCCAKKQITAYGFFWSYEMDTSESLIGKRVIRSKDAKIIVKDALGNVLDACTTIMEFSQKAGIGRRYVWSILNGQKSRKFIMEYL